MQNERRFAGTARILREPPLNRHAPLESTETNSMKLFTYTTTLLLVGAALTFAAPDQNAVETKEKAAWQAFKDKKTDDFKKLVAADFIGVYADGISTLQGELDGMQKSDLKSFP